MVSNGKNKHRRWYILHEAHIQKRLRELEPSLSNNVFNKSNGNFCRPDSVQSDADVAQTGRAHSRPSMKMEMFQSLTKNNLSQFFTQMNKNLGFYITVFITVAYHLISEKDFTCACTPQNQETTCWLHLFLPMLLVVILLILQDKSIYRVSEK